MAVDDEVRRALARKFEVILPHLDERQRRLLLGAEAQALGHGGIRAVARAAGVREATVSLGIDELEAGEPPLGRVRRPGGGRKPATVRDPDLLPALLDLVEPAERGDPMSPLRWTTISLRSLADALTRQGHRVSAVTVGDLLRAEGFSMQANAKTLEGRQHPDRDGQFRYLNEQVKQYQATGDPVISVDTKKKEQLGLLARPGRQWRPAGQPTPVRDHSFPDPALGTVVPYGVYDMTADSGWVNVGTDHDTAGFAVASIRRWWAGRGRIDHPHARRLLITADAGGSNGYRTRAFKTGLAALATETGIPITVCHFPPGTSKWNKIEHRLFSHITMNWRGRPLTSHEVVVQSIAATTTRTGLHVHAELDPGQYATGTRISDRQLAALPLQRHDWHPDWNYTLHPQPEPHHDTRPPASTPTPPDLTWLNHPALTGRNPRDWTNLLTAVTALHPTTTHRRPGNPPRHTIAEHLLATILNHRLGIPQTELATLFGIGREALNHHIQRIRRALQQTGHTVPPGPDRIATLHDLYRHAERHGITPTKHTT